MNKRNLYRFTVLIATAFLITISSFSENRTVVNDDYFEITKRTLLDSKDYCNGKVVSILEGGYDLNALAESAEEHVKALIKY